MSSQATFPELREILTQPPSRDTFFELLVFFSVWDAPEPITAELLYASEHLSTWSDDDRHTQLEDLWPTCPVGTPAPSLRLARSCALDGCQLSSEQLITLSSSPHISHLTQLKADLRKTSTQAQRALFHSPQLAKLQTLRLGFSGLGDEGVEALAQSPTLSQLKELFLWSNDIGPKGASALAQSPLLSTLQTLVVWGNQLGSQGAKALAESPHVQQLKLLDISNNGIQDEGLHALTHSASLRSLDALCLQRDDLTTASMQDLAQSPYLTQLKELILNHNQLGPTGITTLSHAPFVPLLENLQLTNTQLDTASARGLLEQTTRLHTLSLGQNDLGHVFVSTLRDLPQLKTLRRLYLEHAQLDDDCIPDLLQSPALTALETLSLKQNNFSPTGLRTLRESLTIQDLRLDTP